MDPKIEVKVMADGSVFLDGQPATLATIDEKFAELAKAKGTVRYYRESAQSQPPPVAKDVIALVAKHRLPISFSSKPDFSDTIDLRNVARQRQ
jgi:hypothetical protein